MNAFMQPAGRKILFTDLDGTLLTDDKLVSDKNRAAIIEILAHGHQFVMATGKPLAGALRVAEQFQLDLPGCYIIACHGGTLYDCITKQVIFQKDIAAEDVDYLLAEAEKYGLYAHIYCDGMILTKRACEELFFVMVQSGVPYRLSETIAHMPSGAVVLVNLDGSDKLQKFQSDHTQWAQDRCDSFFSRDEFLEYIPKGINKGSGLHALLDHLKWEKSTTIAVGDERNDLEILKAADIGVAVANGVDQAKAAADYITENDNNHDAIAEVVEKLILQPVEPSV